MADVGKTNDDTNKKQVTSGESAIESSTGGKLAKPYADSFTSNNQFAIEDAALGISFTGKGIKPIEGAKPGNSATSDSAATPATLDYTGKANEIMEAAGTFKVPTADEIAIGGKVYNKTDIIAQDGTGMRYAVDDRGATMQPRMEAQRADRPMTGAEKAAELQRLAALEAAHLKALNEQIQKNPEPMQFLGHVSENFKSRMQEWWTTVPEHYKELMKKNHIHVVVAETTELVYPNAKNTPARGHGGDSIATTGGAFAPQIHSVLMVEKPVPLANSANKDLGQTKMALFARAWHELGHALDYDALNHFARSPEFAKAFNAGITRMNAEDPNQLARDRKTFKYEVNPDAKAPKGHEWDGPHEEMLAELFSRGHYQTDLKPSDLRLLQVFKEVVDLMRSKNLMPPESQPKQA